MMSLKKTFAGMTAALVLSAGATAIAEHGGPHGAMPVSYEDQVTSYLSERLSDPRSARFQFSDEPYPVFVDIAGHEDVPCWAVDVRVKARMINGSLGGYVPYTVLFMDGEAVALEDDTESLSKA